MYWLSVMLPIITLKWLPTKLGVNYFQHAFFRALVYLTHGFAEYVGRHEELCQLLSENGFLVFGHDHGKY